jgi:hypothetical protein
MKCTNSRRMVGGVGRQPKGTGRRPTFTKLPQLWIACTLAQVEQCGVSIYGGSRLVASKGGEG